MKRPIANLVTYEDGEPLRVGEKEHRRDRHRWELEPASAEDYADRMRGPLGESEPLRHMGHIDRYSKS